MRKLYVSMIVESNPISFGTNSKMWKQKQLVNIEENHMIGPDQYPCDDMKGSVPEWANQLKYAYL